MSVQAVSKHLQVLERAGLVTKGRDAQRRPVHLEAEVFDLMTKWIERYQRRAEERAQRLDAVLADMQTTDDDTPHQEGTRIMSSTDDRRAITTARIEADPTIPGIRFTRDFAGTPEQLFRAHTDPELFVRWNGPDNMETDLQVWDARTGGSWRYVTRDANGTYAFHGCFHEVRNPFASCRRSPSTASPTVWRSRRSPSTDLGDGRTRLEALSLCDSFEGRDMMLASGMEVGVARGLRQARRPARRTALSEPGVA